jgi:hypothetical protein
VAYYDDATASRDELRRVLDAMVSGGRISTTDRDLAVADIESAYRVADDASWYGVDVATFWSDLAARVNANGGRYAAMGGGKASDKTGRTPGAQYAAVVVTGLNAYNSAQATAYAQSWERLWSDVVVESASDYAQAAQTAGKAATNPWMIWGVAAAVLAVVVLRNR